MYADSLGDNIDSCTDIPDIKEHVFSKDLRFELASGKRFGPIKIAYKTFGKLDEKKENAILVFPTLTATPQVARETIEGKEYRGWWEDIVGQGKPIDTEKYFAVCPDHFGGCYGSTGPSSKNPDTGKEFGMSFPQFFVKDMANCAHALVKHLGLKKLKAVIGGSLGGLLALEYCALNKGFVERAIVLGAAHKVSAQAIALNHIARQAIFLDPKWDAGKYYGKGVPERGLSIARQIGHISYLNQVTLEEKFGREETGMFRRFVSMPTQFQVERYLNHQGQKFSKRFDANSYIYLSKAFDAFDLEREFGSVKNAFEGTKTRFTQVSIASDMLFPLEDSKALHESLKKAGAESEHHILESGKGHDAIFLENKEIGKILGKIL